MTARPMDLAARGRWVGWPAAVLLLGLIGYPLGRLLLEPVLSGVSPAAVWEGLRSPFVNTLTSSVAAAVLAVGLGLVAAILVERAGGTTWLHAAMLVPLVVPPFVSAIGWARAFGPTGLIDDLTGMAFERVEGGAGVVMVIAVNAVPITYLVLRSALRTRIRPSLVAAAAVSGAGRLKIVRSITLPVLAPALVSAFGLAFVFGANSFGVPAVLGVPAGFATVTTRIYQDLIRAADPEAFGRVLGSAALLVLLAAAVVGGTDAASGWRTGAITPAGRGPVSRSRRSAVVIWSYAFLTSGLPLVAIGLTSVTRAPGLAPTPDNWTTANFATALAGRGAGAFGVSLTLAVVAASVVVGLGGLTATLAHRSREGRLVGSATILGFAIPGSALAVAIALAYGSALRDGFALILLAYLAKFWALGHRTISGSAAGLSGGPVVAARLSGADARTAARTILIPLLAPALVAAWVIVFLFGFHELTMSSLLYSPGSETLAVVVLNLQQLGDPGATAALAVLLAGAVVAIGFAGCGIWKAVGRR